LIPWRRFHAPAPVIFHDFINEIMKDSRPRRPHPAHLLVTKKCDRIENCHCEKPGNHLSARSAKPIPATKKHPAGSKFVAESGRRIARIGLPFSSLISFNFLANCHGAKWVAFRKKCQSGPATKKHPAGSKFVRVGKSRIPASTFLCRELRRELPSNHWKNRPSTKFTTKFTTKEGGN
jgi:hypothetical protein